MSEAQKEEEPILVLLGRIDERLKNIERDRAVIYGNGRPGLLERVQKLEDFRKSEDSFLKRYGGIVAWAATFLLALYSTIKHH